MPPDGSVVVAQRQHSAGSSFWDASRRTSARRAPVRRRPVHPRHQPRRRDARGDRRGKAQPDLAGMDLGVSVWLEPRPGAGAGCARTGPLHRRQEHADHRRATMTPIPTRDRLVFRDPATACSRLAAVIPIAGGVATALLAAVGTDRVAYSFRLDDGTAVRSRRSSTSAPVAWCEDVPFSGPVATSPDGRLPRDRPRRRGRRRRRSRDRDTSGRRGRAPGDGDGPRLHAGWPDPGVGRSGPRRHRLGCVQAGRSARCCAAMPVRPSARPSHPTDAPRTPAATTGRSSRGISAATGG